MDRLMSGGGVRLVLSWIWLAICNYSPAALAQTIEFGADKSPFVKFDRPVSTAIFPQRGIVVATTGTTSCCSVVIVNIEKKLLTVGGGIGQGETFTSRPLPNEKEFALEPAELTLLVVAANDLWRIPSKFWGAMCGTAPCMFYADKRSEIWLVDGSSFRLETSLTPIDKNSEFDRLRRLVEELAYVHLPKRNSGAPSKKD